MDALRDLGPTIRCATSADAAGIAALINRAFEVEKSFTVGERTSEQEVRTLQEQGYFLVINRRGEGLAASIFVKMTAERGYFGLLSVDPRFQGSGLGRRLVAVAEALCQARGCTAMDLQVVSLRAELPPWYRSLGYRECGTAPFTDHSTVPCHYIRMTKALA